MLQRGGSVIVAGLGCEVAGDDVEQCRLAGAVASDQADALAGVDRQRSRIEQWHIAIGELRVEQREQRHRVP